MNLGPLMTPAKACSLSGCPKCGYHAGRLGTWGGPIYEPGMDAGTTNRDGERIGEKLAYTCKVCGYTHRDDVLYGADLDSTRI